MVANISHDFANKLFITKIFLIVFIKAYKIHKDKK